MAQLSVASRSLVNRREVARHRSQLARESLASCHFCSHHCGVNRLTGHAGICKAGHQAHVFSAQTEVTDELDFIPTFALSFGGCDFRCSFCVTGNESWNPRAGSPFAPETLAASARNALENGARSVMFLGGEPTIHLHAALELVSYLPDTAKLIWKTNTHASSEARELLRGIFDVWLADYKFGNDVCAQNLAGIANYTEIVQANLLWAFENTELVIRHLLMPGHVECCWKPVASWLAAHLPGVPVSLLTGFWPGWFSARHAELQHPNQPAAIARAHAIAREFDLNLVQ
jgi:putative pyruvate formate lyase activating enzyme